MQGQFHEEYWGDAMYGWRKWIMRDLGVLYFVSFERWCAFD